jgi:glycosyltransferase involved in cell wall biosynthesis/peptidoglycan/xylan/chitin deacetylase (PgdA/CDA1 family)
MSCQISVVIPTFNRCALLRQCLDSLERQTVDDSAFEVIVVVDGSTDGTEAFLKEYQPEYAFRYLVQENKGLSAARNAGNRIAAGNIILCLDNDMIAAPELVAAHLHIHDATPGSLVQGNLKIHAGVVRSRYLRYEEQLLERLFQEKAAATELSADDVAGGNISIARDVLEKAGGFNEELRSMRNTDGELAYRLERLAVPVRYCPQALAYQTHVKEFEEALEASTLYGRAYVHTSRQFPESIWDYSPLVNDRCSILRNLARRCYTRPRTEWGCGTFEAVLRLGRCLAELAGLQPVAAAFYRLHIDYCFWRGVHAEAGADFARFVPRGVSILCYHNVSQTRIHAFRLYIMNPEKFAGQMRWLCSHGYQAVSMDQLHAYLARGEPLPEKPVMITFDDAYEDLARHATPLLAELGLHHVHFINSGKLGRTSDWVDNAPKLPIMSAEAARDLQERFGDVVDLQAHGKDHLSFEDIDNAASRVEVEHCLEVLAPLARRAVNCLAYPYGEYREETPGLMRQLGIRCSFTVDQGQCRPGQDLQLLPRVEVFGHDLPIDFRLKVKYGWSPIATSRAWLKRKYKKAVRVFFRMFGVHINNE